MFEAMPAEVQAQIRAGEVEIGFTMTQVRLAKGEPDRVGRRTTAAGEEVVWTYLREKSRVGLGLGLGLGSGGVGGGVGVSSGGGGPDVALRAIFVEGVVTALEDYSRGK